MKPCLLFLLLIFTAAFSGNAQQANQPSSKVKVFLDCSREWLCDFNYVRKEIKMVDFVRDRFLADVHVLVITQFSSGGGEQNQLNFMGQKDFSGKTDTLQYFNNPTMTEDEKRKQLVQYLNLGLVQYVAKSVIGEKLTISYLPKDSTATQETTAQQKKDPWNFWQFRTGASGFFDGNKFAKSQNINLNFSAVRETNTSRSNISLDYQYSKTIYIPPAGPKETADLSNLNTTAFHQLKFNEHWAAGFGGTYSKSVPENLNHRFIVRPRVEYSITPYKRFNSERIIIQYMIGPEYSNYIDTSFYYKTEEWQVKQSFNIISSFTKKWGSINVGGFWSNYMSDFKKNNLEFSGSINWRIFKGFQFGIGGRYTFVKDQINVSIKELNPIDVITGRRPLPSPYNYFVGIGFSYTFGSIYNNAVMPAFRGLNWGLNF